MKLFYDKKANDPTYYAQQGIRNGKKTTTRNRENFGKHSELLKIYDDPLAYVNEEIRKMNEKYRIGRVNYDFKINFNEKVESAKDEASKSEEVNIGYFFLQEVMHRLDLKDFFSDAISVWKIKFDPYTILRFMTYARIIDPCSKLHTWECLDNYYHPLTTTRF